MRDRSASYDGQATIGDEVTITEEGDNFFEIGIVVSRLSKDNKLLIKMNDGREVLCNNDKIEKNNNAIKVLAKKVEQLERRIEYIESKIELHENVKAADKTNVQNLTDASTSTQSLKINDMVRIRWAKNFWTGKNINESGRIVKITNHYVWVEMSDGKVFKKRKYNVIK